MQPNPLEQIAEISAYEAQLHAFIEEVRRKFNIPGLCVEVAANGFRAATVGGTLAVDVDLPMSRNARFAIGGNESLLTGWALLHLSAQKRIDLDAPVGTYVSELSDSPVGNEVRVRHLLTHSGGHLCANFSHDEVREHYSWERCAAALREASLPFAPGTVFSYSPTATVLLNAVVCRAHGSSVHEVVRSNLLGPLQIDAGSLFADSAQPDLDVPSHMLDPATGKLIRAPQLKLGELWRSGLANLTMSLADLVSLHEALAIARESDPGDDFPVPGCAARTLQEQVVRVPFCSGGPRSEQLPLSIGIGCAEFAPGWIGNSGPLFGQSVSVRYHATHRIVVAVATNVSMPSVCDSIGREVARTLVDERVQRDPPAVEEDVPSAQELAGNYVSLSGVSARVRVQGANITCELVGRPANRSSPVAMQKDPYNRWVVASDPGRWTFGVFRDPTSGTPCLMVGPSAYKKDSLSM
jgi:CubicO group peptidase (beta-lactamase class C family)